MPRMNSWLNVLAYCSSELALSPSALPPEAMAAMRPATKFAIAMDRNQPPMARPVSLGMASLVTMARPIGDRHSSPIVWIR